MHCALRIWWEPMASSVGEGFSLLSDHTDLPFLDVAIIGNADALVAGNLKHFEPKVGRYKLNVCPPNEFVKNLRAT